MIFQGPVHSCCRATPIGNTWTLASKRLWQLVPNLYPNLHCRWNALTEIGALNRRRPGWLMGSSHGNAKIGDWSTLCWVVTAPPSDVLVGFKAKHAAVKCEMVEGNTNLILGLLLDQRIELGLVEGPCRRREIQVRPFYQDEVIRVAAPFDPLAKVKNPSTKALLERPIISRGLGSGTRRVMELALRQQGCSLSRLRIEQELPSTEAIKRMVAAGAEIGYVSRLSVQQELASGQLVEIHCAKLQMKRSFSVLIPQGPDPIGIVQAFSKFITIP